MISVAVNCIMLVGPIEFCGACLGNSVFRDISDYEWYRGMSKYADFRSMQDIINKTLIHKSMVNM